MHPSIYIKLNMYLRKVLQFVAVIKSEEDNCQILSGCK